MYFLTLDKFFILDNLSFVRDKKYFVQAEGQGKRFKGQEWDHSRAVRHASKVSKKGNAVKKGPIKKNFK